MSTGYGVAQPDARSLAMLVMMYGFISWHVLNSQPTEEKQAKGCPVQAVVREQDMISFWEKC